MQSVAFLFIVMMVCGLVQECDGQSTVSSKKDMHCTNNDKSYIYNALDILNVKINEITARKSFKQRDLQQLQQQLSEEVTERKAEQQQLQGQLQQHQQQQQQLSEEVTERKAEQQQLQGQLQQQDQHQQRLQQQLNQEVTERKAMQQQLQELQGQLQQIKSASWPFGTFTLPKPKSGCPNHQEKWQEGMRHHDTEDTSDQSEILGDLLDATRDSTSISWKFCTKTLLSGSNEWMPGKYCLMKSGDCPNGFLEGQIYWDDEDTNNDNTFNGLMPDGVFSSNSRFNFCCREDGLTSNSIQLPTETPFVLLKKSDACQNVYGMSFTEESIFWDCEDDDNANSMSGSYPYNNGGSSDIRLHFCVYQKL